MYPENTKPRNPNAFPTPPETSIEYNENGQSIGSQEGMTLRDYFANSAMQASDLELYANKFGKEYAKYVAKDSYDLADAMLIERSKNK